MRRSLDIFIINPYDSSSYFVSSMINLHGVRGSTTNLFKRGSRLSYIIRKSEILEQCDSFPAVLVLQIVITVLIASILRYPILVPTPWLEGKLERQAKC